MYGLEYAYPVLFLTGKNWLKIFSNPSMPISQENWAWCWAVWVLLGLGQPKGTEVGSGGSLRPPGRLQELDDSTLVSRELEFWEILYHSCEVGCGRLSAGRVVGWGQGHSLEPTHSVGWPCPGLAGWGNGCQFTIFIPSLPCCFVHSIYFNISIFICLWETHTHTHALARVHTRVYTHTHSKFCKRKARQITVSFWKKKKERESATHSSQYDFIGHANYFLGRA